MRLRARLVALPLLAILCGSTDADAMDPLLELEISSLRKKLKTTEERVSELELWKFDVEKKLKDLERALELERMARQNREREEDLQNLLK